MSTRNGQQTAINAVGNITILSNSIRTSSVHASNSSGGFAGSGESDATANINNDNEAYVGDNARIAAQGNVTIQAQSNHITDAAAHSTAAA